MLAVASLASGAQPIPGLPPPIHPLANRVNETRGTLSKSSPSRSPGSTSRRFHSRWPDTVFQPCQFEFKVVRGLSPIVLSSHDPPCYGTAPSYDRAVRRTKAANAWVWLSSGMPHWFERCTGAYSQRILRSVDVKLVRRVNTPCIAAINGLLAANTEGCPGDSY